MATVAKIDITDKNGEMLATEKRYCERHLLVVPKLNALSVDKNGTYPVPDGYAGNGEVEVQVPVKTEQVLTVTENGIYTAPAGVAFTSVVVRVQSTSGGGDPDDDTHVHSYKAVVIAPTCVRGGYTTHVCGECGDQYSDTPTAALGHDWSDPYESDEFSGSYGRKCKRCGELEELECPHTEEAETVTKQPTCTAAGVMTYTCKNCGNIRTEPIARLDHDWSSPYASDEFSSGYGRRCRRCGELEEMECPHSEYTQKITTQPTCSTQGVLTLTCSICGHQWTDPVPELDHDYVAEVTAPTCTAKGYTTHICSLCGHSYVDNETAALGHDWSSPYASDEFSSGYGCRCRRCGELEEMECPHESSSGKVTTEATCEAAGIRTYYCDICGTRVKSEPIPAYGHSWSYYEDPNVSSGQSRRCTRCGRIEEDV